MSSHLLRHAGLSAGLAGVMSHAGRHVMTWGDTRVLLHTAGMKTTRHSLHHVGILLVRSMIHQGGLSTPRHSWLSHAFLWGEDREGYLMGLTRQGGGV